MGSMNKVILIGNLGRDAEMRFTAGGTPVANFSLATTERYTDREGAKQEKTEWHRIILWGKAAEALTEYLVKGKQVAVEGKLETREWTNKEGQKVKTTEIRAHQVTLLGGGRRDGGGRSGEDGGAQAPAGDDSGSQATGDVSDDDIPF